MIAFRKAVRPQRGAAALEFALVLPMFVLIIYGLVTFGSVFYTQITLSRAAADGARALGSVQGIAGFESAPEPVKEGIKDGIKLDVINSLAQSIVTPLGLGGFEERETWVQDNVQITVNQDGCGGTASGAWHVRVALPFAQVRILPSITLPMIGSMDAWMPQTLTGCAITQL